MRRCSIFVTLLKNEYIEVEFNKARCFCSFRCLSNPHSCTITSLIFRTQGIRALLSVRKFLRVQVSVRIVPCATFLVRSLPCAYFRAQISSCASFRIPTHQLLLTYQSNCVRLISMSVATIEILSKMNVSEIRRILMIFFFVEFILN